MSRTRVVLDNRRVAEFLSSAVVERPLAALGHEALAAARASAPERTGAYKAGLSMAVGPAIRPAKRQPWQRSAAFVVAKAPHSVTVEASKGTLQRALQSIARGS